MSNNTAYTFTVHASNAAANSEESTPSNAVTPLVSNLPVMAVLVTGPISVNPVPALVTYEITVTNTSLFPVTGIQVNNVLSTTDNAFIIVGEPAQGQCTAGGTGVTTVICTLGNMAPGAVITIDVVAQMQKAQITMTSRVTGFDSNGSSLTFKVEHRTTTPPGAPPPANAPKIPVPVTAQATPATLNPGQSGILSWTASDTTPTAATNVSLTITIDSGLTINSVSVTPASASCNPPEPGLVNTNVVTCNIAALGGAKNTNPTSMKVTIGITAPNQSALTFLPSGTVDVDGINTSNGTANLVVKVH